MKQGETMARTRHEAPMPTHGDGMTATVKLQPQACRACGRPLVIIAGGVGELVNGAVVEVERDPDTVACPNGCEECV